MLEVVRYNKVYKAAWDSFVNSSNNGTFLFFRDYIAYHSDRFIDHSLLFYKKGKLIALLPANESGSEIHSHGGLSYGGIISDSSMKAPMMLRVFEALPDYLKGAGFEKLVYKAIPHIYHQSLGEADLYALYVAGATLVRRDLNSVICLHDLLPYSLLRRRKLAKVTGLELQESKAFDEFMKLEQELLQVKYNLKPVHSAEEMNQLALQFPKHIKLYTARENEGMIAGIIIYETKTVAHCQYIGATERGKQIAALDALIDHLITDVYSGKKYFSFGVSTEQQGMVLNEKLIRNKESYGARSVVQDFYELKL